MGRVSDAKERLMTAVMDLICAGSYGSTTIDLICEKAGVKKGSFYYFYDSKSDLAVKALDAPARGTVGAAALTAAAGRGG
jgi:TetR/AcrR family transcriptional repressor of nem operon